MNEQLAENNLQVIRTLMERTAVYRRALAPVMVMTGSIGTLAALVGFLWQPPFVLYWASVAVVVLVAALVLTRRQALKDGEPFWSPPTRRVVQALLPGLFVAAVVTAALGQHGFAPAVASFWLMLYGCALHAAGFFAPQRLRVLGWVFIAGGAIQIMILSTCRITIPITEGWAHVTMGVFFGLLHLGVGAYLYAITKTAYDL